MFNNSPAPSHGLWSESFIFGAHKWKISVQTEKNILESWVHDLRDIFIIFSSWLSSDLDNMNVIMAWGVALYKWKDCGWLWDNSDWGVRELLSYGAISERQHLDCFIFLMPTNKNKTALRQLFNIIPTTLIKIWTNVQLEDHFWWRLSFDIFTWHYNGYNL